MGVRFIVHYKYQANYLVEMNESFLLASSATDFASLPPENVTLDPVNATIAYEALEYGWAMDYTCTQVHWSYNSSSIAPSKPLQTM